MINDLASLTLYLISKIGKKIKVTRPGYEKSKLLGSLDNWEPGQLSRIIQSSMTEYSPIYDWKLFRNLTTM